MSRYLLIADHDVDGPSLLDAGGTARRDVLRRTADGLGGEVLSFDSANDGVFVLAELPSDAAVTALAMLLRGPTTQWVHIVSLMTAEEVDVAAQLV